jgi:hypothetical protein
MLVIRTFVFAAVMGTVLVGCGTDCAKICEDRKKCEGADQAANCETQCENDELTAEAAGCENQYEEALSCKGEQDDACTIEEACASELSALTMCVAK